MASTIAVDFVVERLALEPGASFLDVACGHGRHALELARRGFRVTGVDLSEPSLEATWTLLAPDGGRTELRHSLCVYTLPELRAMLARAGLETVETWSGWDGEPYGFEGRRLIVHARKAA